MAITAGLATQLLTLSENLYMSTYMVLGLVTAYLRLINLPKILGFRVNSALIKRFALINIATLVGLYTFIRLFK